MFHSAMIVGPALAGLLLASAAPAGTSGIAWLYFLNAVSFGGTLGALVVMRTPAAPEGDAATRESPVAALQAGLRFVFGSPILVWTMLLDFVATFFSASLSLLPIFADQILGVGASGFGWLRSAPAIGAVLGRSGPPRCRSAAAGEDLPVVRGSVRRRDGRLRPVPVLHSHLRGARARRPGRPRVHGGSTTVRQLITPDGLRGRMTSVNMLFFMGGPQLGELEAGLVASLFASAALGATVSVVSGGLLTVLVTIWVAARAPVVRRFDVDEVL